MANHFAQRNDALARALRLRLAQELPAAPGRPAEDSLLAAAARQNSLAQAPGIRVGRVVDMVAYMHQYLVQCERGGGLLVCTSAAHSSMGLVGAKDLHTYPVGTAVVVLVDVRDAGGVILASIPDYTFDGRHALSDFIVKGSNVGLQVDGVHSYPLLNMQSNGGLADYSAGRPFDGLSGERGFMAATGVGLVVDDFMAALRVDEATGLFVFYYDQLLRLAGLNLQLRSSGANREDLNDQNEFSSVEGYTPYQWEARGAYAYSDTVAQALTAAAQIASPDRADLEPLQDDQLGIYREQHIHGYLGQGGRTQLITPVSDGAVHRYSSETILQGLAEDGLTADGMRYIRSARGFLLERAPILPQPKIMKRPEDLSGDTPSNYKFCGIFGSGTTPSVQSGPEGGSDLHLVETAALRDRNAYTFNWQALHPFYYHAEDYYLPNDSDMPQASTVADTVPDFSSLSDDDTLPLAPSFTFWIDDRYGLEAYYASRSAFALLPGGGVSLTDAWGSELRMVGGKIFINAPGDVVITSGRNILSQAGWNNAVKANYCVEVAAEAGDARIKAEQKVMIMGGNNGCGGVEIESRASGIAFQRTTPEDTVAGILLIAPESAIALVGTGLLLDTGSYGESDSHMVFNAGDEGSLVTMSQQFRRHITQCALDFFGTDPDDFVVNEFWPDMTTLGTALTVVGASYLWGCVGVYGNLMADGTVGASAFGAITDDSFFTDVNSAITERDLSDVLTDSLDELNFLADETDVLDLSFYFQTSTQNMADAFLVYEPLWHQQARLSSQSLPTWSTNAVSEDLRGATSPFPGYAAWVSGTGYGLQDLNLFDTNNNRNEDRGSDYETPAYADTDFVAFNDNWPVIANP